jgi:glyoxylate reductase
MMARILIAAELRQLLAEDPLPGHAVEWIPASELTPAGDFAAVVPILSRQFGNAEFDTLPALRIVANCAVGYDNVDVDAARRHGVIVTNTPDVLTDATADLAWYLILAVARRAKEGEALIRARAWTGWHPQQLLGLELRGATLGIVGAGRIGQAVGHRAVAFGMRIVYVDREERTTFEESTGARRVSLGGLLAQSDVVSLHVPATAETRGMVDEGWFARMRPGSFLINTARGDVVQESARAAAPGGGRRGGAGLDVFPREPEVHPALVSHLRVVTLPHLGSATVATRRAMVGLAVRNVREVLAGRPPLTPVPGSV